MPKWTDAEMLTALHMSYNKGLSAAQIGKGLGRLRDSVLWMLTRVRGAEYIHERRRVEAHNRPSINDKPGCD